jgi:hypothetical protein
LTLVELLIALAILVTVSASSLLVFRGVTRAWRTGELRTERYQQARLLVDLFERELTSSTASAAFAMVGRDAADPDPWRPASAYDELFFVGTLPGRAGLIERGYWVTGDGVLMCHDGEPADGDYGTGTDELCGRDLTQFDVSFFDGTAWLDRWDGRPDGPQAGTLPKAVYFQLTIGRQPAEPFETIVYVPTS